MQYYVYIMTNPNNTTLYVGITNNLQRRVYEHKNKLIDGFTKRYNITKLVYFEIADSAESAIMREKKLKWLTRERKNKLIEKHNPGWQDLDKINF